MIIKIVTISLMAVFYICYFAKLISQKKQGIKTDQLGKGKEGFILGACRQGICFIPVILILPFVWGLNGILYAQPIADVLSALITVFMAIPLHKSLTIAEQKMKTTSIPCDRQ